MCDNLHNNQTCKATINKLEKKCACNSHVEPKVERLEKTFPKFLAPWNVEISRTISTFLATCKSKALIAPKGYRALKMFVHLGLEVWLFFAWQVTQNATCNMAFKIKNTTQQRRQNHLNCVRCWHYQKTISNICKLFIYVVNQKKPFWS